MTGDMWLYILPRAIRTNLDLYRPRIVEALVGLDGPYDT